MQPTDEAIVGGIAYFRPIWDPEITIFIILFAIFAIWSFVKFRREKIRRTGRDGKPLIGLFLSTIILAVLVGIFLHRASEGGKLYLAATPEYVFCEDWRVRGESGKVPWSNIGVVYPPETPWWKQSRLPFLDRTIIRFAFLRPLPWQDQNAASFGSYCDVTGLDTEPEEIHRALLDMRRL